MSERQFKLREMRNRAKLNQQQVADALGIPKGRYGDWERETTTLNLKDAIELADLFNCTLDELAGRKSPNDSDNLNADEQRIIDAYRSDRHARRTIDHAVADYIEDLEDDAREKKEVI
jgi:DNA-binding XRE family transcriptional regulator